jgi:hypothetical protein
MTERLFDLSPEELRDLEYLAHRVGDGVASAKLAQYTIEATLKIIERSRKLGGLHLRDDTFAIVMSIVGDPGQPPTDILCVELVRDRFGKLTAFPLRVSVAHVYIDEYKAMLSHLLEAFA